MNAQELVDQLEQVRTDAEQSFAGVATSDDVEKQRVAFLGKKGRLTAVLRGMGKLGKDDRPTVGAKANEIRDRIEGLIAERTASLKSAAREAEFSTRLDISLAGRRHRVGRKHPLTQTAEDILSILNTLGFRTAEGPEVEHDFYNFESLNMPPDHPARDMQDTFYIDDKVVMRTHTSPVQVRTMLNQKTTPVRVACFGRVYRNDHDITHSPMFHQIEGLYVDKDVTLADLKGTLAAFAEEIFEPGTQVRLRPSFFPFTEPSAEVDISCFNCNGTGVNEKTTCRICKGTGWIEIMGAGLVDPSVLENAGLDPEEVSGFAFGIGVERVAMLRYGVSDIRLFFENDRRFLRQFY